MVDTQIMANIIADQSARAVLYPRQFADPKMDYWYQGRVDAAALISPSVETLSAANQIRFFISDYAYRHGIYK